MEFNWKITLAIKALAVKARKLRRRKAKSGEKKSEAVQSVLLR
jgi:hypothetical protein